MCPYSRLKVLDPRRTRVLFAGVSRGVTAKVEDMLLRLARLACDGLTHRRG
jgi:hypothetical protein